MKKRKSNGLMACPECGGVGIDHGCIGESSCSVCFGRGKIPRNLNIKEFKKHTIDHIVFEYCNSQKEK